jgi:methylglutaconyl-CoA hydratase
MFSSVFESSKIVMAAVHGNVFGGGNGLVAVCDMACCLENSRFCLSETRIGMAAATITPYLLQKMKASDLKELIYTAKSFDGKDAVRYGLVNQSFPSEEAMDGWLKTSIAQMLENGKLAQAASKRLINKFSFLHMAGEMEKIPELLANIRVSPEAQKGFKAFLEKRKPNW